MEKDKDSDLRPGWIGLGKMGLPMAQNIFRKHKSLTVFNRTIEKSHAHSSQNGHVSHSIGDLAAASNIIFTMISDDAAIEDVILGRKGVFSTARENTILIEMSTISPSISDRIAAKAENINIKYIRAPVNGTVMQAEGGTLVILVSGPKKAFDDCHTLFELLGNKIFYIGDGDEARYLKLCINTMVGITSSMMGEALTLGEAGGLDWNTMIEIIAESAVGSPLINYKKETLKNRDFTPAFNAYQMAKDFKIILNTAKQNNVPMPLASAVCQQWSDMINLNRGELDYFGYVEMLEEIAGIKNK